MTMPIKLNSNLPAFAELQAERVPLIDSDWADQQDIRPLNIGFLNLMPSTAFQGTEKQWFRLLGRTPLQINPILVDFDNPELRTTKGAGRQHLDNHYQPFTEVQKQGLDGLIITGANVEFEAPENIKYLSALQSIMDWASENVTSTIYSCWAAQVAADHFWGIAKDLTMDRRKKIFGVFEHELLNSSHPLTRSLDDRLEVPHSRYGGLPLSMVEAEPELEVLIGAQDPAVGFHVAASHDVRTVLMQGHGEYDRYDLHHEYQRDKGTENETERPKQYYNPEEGMSVSMNWRANAQTFISNWVTHIYEKTGFDPLRPNMD